MGAKTGSRDFSKSTEDILMKIYQHRKDNVKIMHDLFFLFSGQGHNCRSKVKWVQKLIPRFLEKYGRYFISKKTFLFVLWSKSIFFSISKKNGFQLQISLQGQFQTERGQPTLSLTKTMSISINTQYSNFNPIRLAPVGDCCHILWPPLVFYGTSISGYEAAL